MKKGIALLCALLLSTAALPKTTAFAAETDTAASGDLNADGEFSIADVVLLQKKLLTVPDTVLADWQAGYLCADCKLDALDLGAMRQALTAAPPETPDTPDALEQLRGMDYETAVAKGYIARAEYNYQISGALKQTAEEALGRALDYSIDRFYLVINDALGLDDSTRYLYHSGTGMVFPITEDGVLRRHGDLLFQRCQQAGESGGHGGNLCQERLCQKHESLPADRRKNMAV